MSAYACLFLPLLVPATEAPSPRPSCTLGADAPGAQADRVGTPGVEEPWDADDDFDSLIDAINANFVAEVRASLERAGPRRPANPA